MMGTYRRIARCRGRSSLTSIFSGNRLIICQYKYPVRPCHHSGNERKLGAILSSLSGLKYDEASTDENGKSSSQGQLRFFSQRLSSKYITPRPSEPAIAIFPNLALTGQPHRGHMNAARDSEDVRRENDAIVCTQVGAAANVALALSKGAVGVIMQSTALIADAVHAASDLLTDFVVYFTITESRKAATPDRPWGMGKVEPLGALSIGGLLLVTGAGIGYQAGLGIYDIVTAVNDPTLAAAAAAKAAEAKQHLEGIEALIDEMKDGHSSLVHQLALGLTAFSIVIKEALFHYTTYIGKKVHSDSVRANAWHHRSDAIVSGAVFVGLAGSMAGYPVLDPIAGVLVSGLIAQQGFTTTWDALQDLSDAPSSKEETDSLRDLVLGVPGVLSVETLHARRSGPFLYVECTVGVPGNISASAAHRLAELARSQMMSMNIPGQRKVANALVDVDPLGSAGLGERSPSWARDHDSVARAVEKSLLSLENIIAVTEVQVYYRDDGRIKLKVDVSMNPELSIKAAHKLAVLARNRIELDLPGVASVDVDLELDEGYSKLSD